MHARRRGGRRSDEGELAVQQGARSRPRAPSRPRRRPRRVEPRRGGAAAAEAGRRAAAAGGWPPTSSAARASTPRGAPPRAGVVVDARQRGRAVEQRGACALCVQILRSRGARAVWTAVAPPNTAVARVWVGGGLCRATRRRRRRTMAARTFHLLTPLPPPARVVVGRRGRPFGLRAPSRRASQRAARASHRSPRGAAAAAAAARRAAARAPAPGGALLVKFFGVPEGESVEAATPDSLTPFEPAVDAPLTDVSPPEQGRATLDALNWLRRSPPWPQTAGARRRSGGGAALHYEESLVGRDVQDDELWPSESAWYPALVRAYNAVDGKRCFRRTATSCDAAVVVAGAPTPPAAAQTLGVRFGFGRPLTPRAPPSLAGTTAGSCCRVRRGRDAPRAAPACRPRAEPPRAGEGFLSFTTGGDRLFAPASTCAGCQVAGTAPGRLLLRSVRARAGTPSASACPPSTSRRRSGEWVCGHCATCDGCGALAVSEIEGHWAPDAAHDLQNGWYVAAGHKLLCVACHGGVRSGGCDARPRAMGRRRTRRCLRRVLAVVRDALRRRRGGGHSRCAAAARERRRRLLQTEEGRPLRPLRRRAALPRATRCAR